MEDKLAGLSAVTASILRKAGLDTRRKVSEAGEIEWLKLPMFGKKRMIEVDAWLGVDAPAVRRDIERCIRVLTAAGYAVSKPR